MRIIAKVKEHEDEDVKRLMNQKCRICSIFILISVIIVIAIFSYFHVMLPNRDVFISDNKSRIYSVDKSRSLLVWNNHVFFIYTKDHWVGRASDYRNRFLGRIFWPKDSSIVFWPRGSYAGVPIDDGVKIDSRNKFRFNENNITIQFFFENEEKPDKITIKL